MILDGKALAEEIRSETALSVSEFKASTGVTPCLAAVLVGDRKSTRLNSSHRT